MYKHLCKIVLVCSLLVNSVAAQTIPIHIKKELDRAARSDNQEYRLNTYHVYDKYLSPEQLYELNMYYVSENVCIPHERRGKYWLLRMAEKGNTCAQINLAYSYSIGRIVPQNFKQAKYWYTKAWNAGDTTAAYHLGLLYWSKVGKLGGLDSVVQYWQKAKAYHELNVLYELGLIQKPNIVMPKLNTNSLISKYDSTVLNSLPNVQAIHTLLHYDAYQSATLDSLQLTAILKNRDTSCRIMLLTNGNSNYEEVQASWNRAFKFKKMLMNRFGYSNEAIQFRFSGSAPNQYITLIIYKPLSTTNIVNPPPPFPGINANAYYFSCDIYDNNMYVPIYCSRCK